MVIKSFELWEQFVVDMGEDMGFCWCGLFYLSNDEEEFVCWMKWCDFVKMVGVIMYMLSSIEVFECGCFIGCVWKGGVFLLSDGMVDFVKVVLFVVVVFMKFGGIVYQNCVVWGIEIEGGCVSGVVIEVGIIKICIVVFVGGVWVLLFCC